MEKFIPIEADEPQAYFALLLLLIICIMSIYLAWEYQQEKNDKKRGGRNDLR